MYHEGKKAGGRWWGRSVRRTRGPERTERIFSNFPESISFSLKTSSKVFNFTKWFSSIFRIFIIFWFKILLCPFLFERSFWIDLWVSDVSSKSFSNFCEQLFFFPKKFCFYPQLFPNWFIAPKLVLCLTEYSYFSFNWPSPPLGIFWMLTFQCLGEPEWASRIIFAIKNDCTIQFCVDYRERNSITMHDPNSLGEWTSKRLLGASTAFSTLETIRRFWRVQSAKDHRVKTAFLSRYGLFLSTCTCLGSARPNLPGWHFHSLE